MTLRKWYESLPEDCKDKEFYLLVSLDPDKFDWLYLEDNDANTVQLHVLPQSFIGLEDRIYFPVFISNKTNFNLE